MTRPEDSAAPAGPANHAFPARPRLAAHVLARRHLVGGEERIVLHDLAGGRAVQIGRREWGILAASDGTRDIGGVVLAAAREGAHARAAAVEAFLGALHQAGMLEDGIEDEGPAADTAPGDGAGDMESAAARPLAPLPGYTLSCDGSGSCCRLYGSVIFGPVEAARARALLPLLLGGGERHERVFMPERGSGPTGGSAVTYCEGRCAYLDDAGGCLIHAAGGPGAKPVGCRTFPASFIDDGEVVRVSVSVECACVLASEGRPGGAPLIPASAKTRADLDPTLVIDQLPDHLLVTADHTAPRSAFLAWSRAVTATLPVPDAAASLLSLSRAVRARGLDEGAAREALCAPRPVDPAEISPWAAALAARAARKAREDASFRSDRDLVLRAAGWIAEAASALADPRTASTILAQPPAAARHEAFYLTALLHGHRFAGGRPVAAKVHDHALRVLTARALGHVLAAIPEPERDPAAAHPLALVEAMLRGHGLDGYHDDMPIS